MTERPENPPRSNVERLLRARKVLDMPALEAAAGGRSRRSLFRDLEKLGYLSSFNHAGRYYTLFDIPRFDDHGLWFRGEAGFSRRGTLKETVAYLVREGPSGRTHAELRSLLRVRAQNTLLDLVHRGAVRREEIEGLGEFVYVSPDPQVAGRQIADRERSLLAREPPLPPTETVLAILAETLRTGRVVVPANLVAQRLCAGGTAVETEEVERVLAHYGLVGAKKNGSPPRRPSPP